MNGIQGFDPPTGTIVLTATDDSMHIIWTMLPIALQDGGAQKTVWCCDGRHSTEIIKLTKDGCATIFHVGNRNDWNTNLTRDGSQRQRTNLKNELRTYIQPLCETTPHCINAYKCRRRLTIRTLSDKCSQETCRKQFHQKTNNRKKIHTRDKTNEILNINKKKEWTNICMKINNYEKRLRTMSG